MDLGAQLLLRGDEVVSLTPKAYQLLALLLCERPCVVSKREIQEALWPETYVVEANMPNLVAEIRTALGDSAREPKYIRTSHGVGYAFCGAAFAYGPQSSARADAPTTCALLGQGRLIRLPDGEHVLGRSSQCEVRLAGAAVSRRHALIRVRGRTAVIEDLHSSNGTHVQGRRISGSVVLSEGDRIRIGEAILRFLLFDPIATTDQMAPAGLSDPIDVGDSGRPRRILGRS
jgi:DNA-binding winged helix-turn-helix (wHTH) protein